MGPNKTRRKFELLKDMKCDELDFTVQIEKLKTMAIMYGDWLLASEIKLYQINGNKNNLKIY